MSFFGMQQQELVSKQEQVEAVVHVQLVLDITRKCIKNIKQLGNLYIKEMTLNQNNDNNNDNNDDIDMNGSQSLQNNNDDSKQCDNNNNNNNNNNWSEFSSEIFMQQMIAGQLLNALRMAISDKKSVSNGSTAEISLLELGKFKNELLNGNVPKSLVSKLMPFVDTMQVTLQDYKKSFHVPAPKLNETSFNTDSVSAGMEVFLGSQHKIDDRKKEIRNNVKKFGNEQKNALNDKNNRKLLNKMKNEKIDSNKMNSQTLFFNVNQSYLDIDNNNNNNGNNDDNELDLELMYGRAGMKEYSCNENEKKYRAKQSQQQHSHHCKHK